jgi:hypothetical protein
MQKVILLILAFTWASAVFAQETHTTPAADATPAANQDSQWSLSLAGGLDLPVNHWQPAYTLGFGGQAGVRYEMDKTWALELGLEDFYFSGQNVLGSASDNELRFLPMLQYAFTQRGLRPYLLAGAGMDLELFTSSLGGGSNFNFDAVIGAGVDVPLNPQGFVFVEAKYNLVFAGGTTGTDIPLLAGIRFDLEGAAPKP